MQPVRFSVIVPIGPGRRAPILGCVDALDAPGGVEVLVERGPNPSHNRNRAIERARGEICAFADDDCIVDAEWLRAADRFFAAHPEYDAVGGPQLTPATDARFARASGHALGSAFGAWSSCRRYRAFPLDLHAGEASLSSANLFVRRATFDRVGGFDSRLWPNEETDLLVRIAAAGGRIAYDPSIVVRHRRRPTPLALAAQCFRYGRGRARQNWLARRTPGAGALIPALFVAYLLGLALLGLVGAPGSWTLVPLAAYASASACATVGLAVRERDAGAAWLLPLAFPTVHLGYGSGLLFETLLLSLRCSDAGATPQTRGAPLRSPASGCGNLLSRTLLPQGRRAVTGSPSRLPAFAPYAPSHEPEKRDGKRVSWSSNLQPVFPSPRPSASRTRSPKSRRTSTPPRTGS